MHDKPSFSTSEVAKLCHVTPDTVRKWAEAGRIEVFRTLGGHRRIGREELARFLKENNLPASAELLEPGVRVLVADAERWVASAVRRFIERAPSGTRLEVASDCFDAGYRVASFKPSIVVLDLHLPGVDGLEVCRRLRALPDTASLQVIALTNADEDLAARAKECGATACLRKPFTPDDLRRAFAKAGVEVL